MGSTSPTNRHGSKERRRKLVLIALPIIAVVTFGNFFYLFRDSISATAYRPVSSKSAEPGSTVEREAIDEINSFRKLVSRKLRRSLFQSWNSTVVDGNWIYMNEELVGVNADAAALEQIVPVVSEFSQDLKELGVDLVFCPLPPKWAVYPGPLEGRQPASMEGSPRLDLPQHQLINRLRKDGVTCIDLLPHFLAAKAAGAPLLFPPDDSHVSPEGADLVAEVLSGFLADRELPPLSTAEQQALRSETLSVERVGDLRRVLLQKGHAGLNDVPFTYRIEPVIGAWESAQNRPADLCLIGDSNLDACLGYHENGRNFDVGIGPRLAFKRGLPVTCLWQGGDGATSPRRKFLNRFQTTPEVRENCKVVVWILTARMLHQPALFETVPVPPRGGVPTNDAEWRNFTVVVKELSEVPKDLGSLAYPDALQTVLVNRLDPESGVKGPPTVLYREYMKNRQAIAARWQPGQTLKISARRWESLAEENAVSRLMIFDSLPFDIELRYYAIPDGENGTFVPHPDMEE